MSRQICHNVIYNTTEFHYYLFPLLQSCIKTQFLQFESNKTVIYKLYIPTENDTMDWFILFRNIILNE